MWGDAEKAASPGCVRGGRRMRQDFRIPKEFSQDPALEVVETPLGGAREEMREQREGEVEQEGTRKDAID